MKCLWRLEKVETYTLVISAEGVMMTKFAKNIAALGLSYNIVRNYQKIVCTRDIHGYNYLYNRNEPGTQFQDFLAVH
ncbi:hypothetical protein NQ318_005494 [Aromia moschata]|uniref:Uncharacterized protein n=1 Tax=Aromia moschata TaxID=1265417 RepID=A0AAV8XQ54_9CUCU|nr:hypothetical protein NQ318_005494 [Aromia moschata]